MSRAQLTSTVEQNTGGAVTPFVAGKNACINGGFDIWQRGTSFSYSSGNTTTYTADRWQTYSNTVATSITRQSSGLTGFRYNARIQRPASSTATSGIYFSQSIETADSLRFAGQVVTLSFYARAGANFSATSNLLNVYLLQGTGTDENALIAGFTGQTNILTSSASLTTSWQRFTFTGTVASTTTEISPYLFYTPTGTAGAADYFDITGIQLEIGSVATPFSRAGGTLQGELALCQRYFYRFTGSNSSDYYASAFCDTSSSVFGVMRLPVTMRTAPSGTTSAASNFGIYGAGISTTLSTITLSNFNKDSVVVGGTASGLTQGRGLMMYANLPGTIDISAEL